MLLKCCCKLIIIYVELILFIMGVKNLLIKMSFFVCMDFIKKWYFNNLMIFDRIDIIDMVEL